MTQSSTFEHAGHQYEVRTTLIGSRTYVRVFKRGQPANGYEYSVDAVTQGDGRSSGLDFVKEIVATAESDIRNGVWDQYVAATSGRLELQVDFHPSGRRTLKQRLSGHGKWVDLQGDLWGNSDRAKFYEAAFRHVTSLIQQGTVVVGVKDTSP